MEPILLYLPCREYEAQIIWDLAFKSNRSSFYPPMDLLIKMLKTQVNNKTCLEFSKLFAKNIEKIELLLKPLPASKLQFNKFQTFQLFRYITQIGDPISILAIVKSDILKHIVDLFFKYSANSIFLAEFTDLVIYLITQSIKNGCTTTNTAFTLLTQLLIEVKFLARLLLVYKTEYRKPISGRSGHFGILTKIGNHLQQATSVTTMHQMVSGVQGWSLFLKQLEEINNLHKIPDCFKPPEKQKATGKIIGDPGVED